MIEDVLLLFLIRFEALSDIPSASKFWLRLSRPLVAVNSGLRVDLTYLQDLSVDLSKLVEIVDFLQRFLEALETMVGLTIPRLLWALNTDPNLPSEDAFPCVQMSEKHTQTCSSRCIQSIPALTERADFPGHVIG